MKRLALALALMVLVAFTACGDPAADREVSADAVSDETPAADDDRPDDPADRDDDATPPHSGALEAGDAPRTDETALSRPTERYSGCKQCVPTPPESWPEADLEDPTVVAWDEDNYFTVDGTRFFPIGFYNIPTDEAGLDAYQAEGFNIGYGGPSCCGSGTQPQIDFLRLAQERGLMAFLRPWSSLEETLTRPEEDLAAELAARNGVGNLFGWHTFDEPALHRPSKELTERVHYILNTYSAEHPDFLVEQTMEDFGMYADDCSIFATDPYPSPYMFLSMVKYAVLEARAAVADAKPVLGVMQAFSWEWYHDNFDEPFHPDAWELRNMMWQFIVLGARGLLPWNYSGDYTAHAVPEIWEAFLGDVAEIKELSAVVLADDAAVDLGVETTFPTMFDYVVKSETSADWVLSVSTNERPMYVTLDVSVFGDELCVVDYTTGETFAADGDGRIEVLYDVYQVRVLEIMPVE